jgi:hypothetical protein
MLDSAILAHTLSRTEIASVAERLVGFYKHAQPRISRRQRMWRNSWKSTPGTKRC